MVDEIAVGAFTGDDNTHGLPTYAAPVIVKARIEEKFRMIRGADGQTRKVDTGITTMRPIGYRDRIWVAPFGGNNAARVFPPSPVYIDSDAKSPVVVQNARKMIGNDGHFEVWF